MNLGDGGQAQYIIVDLASIWEWEIINSMPSKFLNRDTEQLRFPREKHKFWEGLQEMKTLSILLIIVPKQLLN